MYIIPIYNITVLPNAITYLNGNAFKKSTGQEAVEGDKVILLPTKSDKGTEFTTDDFQTYAVTGEVGTPDTNGFVEIRTKYRVHVDDAEILPGGKIQLSLSRAPETEDFTPAEDRDKCTALKKELLAFSKNYDWAPAAKYLLSFCENLNGLIGILSPFMEMEAEERFALLEETSEKKRAEKIEEIIYEWI